MTCSEGHFPETARAFAFNGAEILVCSTANSGAITDFPGVGSRTIRMRSDCAASHLYGVFVDSTGSGIRFRGKSLPENASGGGSMVVDPFGRILQKANDSREQAPRATIPIGFFRAKHEIPMIRTEIYVPVLQQHPGRVPPNLYSKYLPRDAEDALCWSLQHARY